MSTLNNLPFLLRTNDVERHILSIDSRFRDAPMTSGASDFYFTLPVQIRNVLRLRLTSVELPSRYWFFSSKKSNVSFGIKRGAGVMKIVTIQDGNYTPSQLATAVEAALTAAGVSGFLVSFNENNSSFTFSTAPPTARFTIDTTIGSINRPFDYGLGFYLGLSYGQHASVAGDANQILVSNKIATVAGDNYLLLLLNDYYCINHSFYGNTIKAFAKILLKNGPNSEEFDDYAGDHIKEIVLPGPQDLSRIHVQLVDTYGIPVDFGGTNFSFSLEIMEIKNLSLYKSIRDSLASRWIGTGGFST